MHLKTSGHPSLNLFHIDSYLQTEIKHQTLSLCITQIAFAWESQPISIQFPKSMPFANTQNCFISVLNDCSALCECFLLPKLFPSIVFDLIKNLHHIRNNLRWAVCHPAAKDHIPTDEKSSLHRLKQTERSVRSQGRATTCRAARDDESCCCFCRVWQRDSGAVVVPLWDWWVLTARSLLWDYDISAGRTVADWQLY